ncbi:hypothetical protein [Paracoccus sp. TOH]|uniref:Uncharacterized protein n=1 Tax=Paracoccus simplex TaxID=2086346 RepID=A0ABV7S086_9RHOB|nr:hypothetical protein [Paracoccus sp. TOH]WJS86487.1 hypothetical protein NBE95_12935 [Paracoccus sp. TOH]
MLVAGKPVRHHRTEQIIFLCRGLSADGADHLHNCSCPALAGCLLHCPKSPGFSSVTLDGGDDLLPSETLFAICFVFAS